ncbi:tRNA (adenosine(37)-N6)-threonylcarbamoyltransferase complex dimerization subunit type 1 TsaB [Actinobacteria bacterium YIM 96077]|uniref:tRNA (Adenosine(37)-N6)-threonylcarbamoyltransferase complex dimerization subunit type 1 TsaB n=1 Tax=Phytoactinopolyspora halophila TaxID=1981511 RepID=A0A329QGU9_9ACTN|nr:tRNA (adenosine(37)-N6)-threonylcarbamoyltransferase complex dimerization subunit type 1 TsaB [Phytoactinopolyspora halophila]AYY14692.1 tRNA (adenosine(37)-N6)-threonylcarbamoyltransferase complex dimerization subunit type 1 TsaB [Actinobacteria bacterium YIM 96077]RAW11597.1 tRNA (adenosine(37)-N6)-threonylcarbamoyltransferase complex dimerization subunit type 1 TsaB [Phytoactinopolyspora halophila]
MLLLALDTSTPAVTVALHDGERAVAHSTHADARRHTELLAPAISDVLAEAGVDRREITGVAVGIGPGPFTGLRVGVTAARTLGTALDVPVVGVCSLDIIAREVTMREAPHGSPFLVVTDARRREVYWSAYDSAGVRTRGPEVGPASGIPDALPAAGAGARTYRDAFPGLLEPEFPSAVFLAAAVVDGAVDTCEPRPLYLRRPDAAPPAARKPVLTPVHPSR